MPVQAQPRLVHTCANHPDATRSYIFHSEPISHMACGICILIMHDGPNDLQSPTDNVSLTCLAQCQQPVQAPYVTAAEPLNSWNSQLRVALWLQAARSMLVQAPLSCQAERNRHESGKSSAHRKSSSFLLCNLLLEVHHIRRILPANLEMLNLHSPAEYPAKINTIQRLVNNRTEIRYVARQPRAQSKLLSEKEMCTYRRLLRRLDRELWPPQQN